MVEIPVSHEMTHPNQGYNQAYPPRQGPVNPVPLHEQQPHHHQQPPVPPQHAQQQATHQHPSAAPTREIPIQHGSGQPQSHYTSHYQHTPAFNYPNYQHPPPTQSSPAPPPPSQQQQQQQPTYPGYPTGSATYHPGWNNQAPYSNAPSGSERVIPIVRQGETNVGSNHSSPQAARKPGTSIPPHQPSSGVFQQSAHLYTQPEQRANSPKEHMEPSELTPLDMVEKIVCEAKELGQKVNEFQGSKGSKPYRYLEEMLTRMLLKLDNIEAGSDDSIRQARKHAVNTITQTLDLLELKGMSSDDDNRQKVSSDGNEEAKSSSAADPNKPNEQSDNEKKKTPGHVREMVLDSEVAC